MAVSHSVLTIIYNMLGANQDYHDLGPHYFETLDTTRQRDLAVRRLQAMGDIGHFRRGTGGDCLKDTSSAIRFFYSEVASLSGFL